MHRRLSAALILVVGVLLGGLPTLRAAQEAPQPGASIRGSWQQRAGARRSAAQGGGQGSEWGSPCLVLQRSDVPAECRAARQELGDVP